jgi:hypothetical protein
MRRTISVLSSVLLFVGIVWQYGRPLLDYAGRAFAMRDLGELLDRFHHWASEYTGLGNAVGPWVLMGAGVASLLALHVVPPLLLRFKTVPIELHFSVEANLDHKESLFRRSKGFLPSGLPLSLGDVCLHEYYIAVYNPSDRKTLKNVHVMVEGAGHPTIQWPTNKSLMAERTKGDSVDIPPKQTEYFFIGDYLDDSKVGMFHPEIVPEPTYIEWIAERERRKNLGVVVRFFDGGGHPLLKNDGMEVRLIAYADDTPPTERVLVVNCKTRVEISLR